MKLSEIKALRNNELFKKIIDELNIKGLDKIYVKKTKTVDYLDIILSITNFLEQNKNIFKKLNKKNYENLVLIVLVELLDEIDIDTDEEQLEKIILLLKNSLLVQRASNFLLKNLKIIYSKFKINCCGKNVENDVKSINLEIKDIQKGN